MEPETGDMRVSLTKEVECESGKGAKEKEKERKMGKKEGTEGIRASVAKRGEREKWCRVLVVFGVRTVWGWDGGSRSNGGGWEGKGTGKGTKGWQRKKK